MKRSIAVLLIALMVLSAVACGAGNKSANNIVGTWVLDSGVGEEADQYVSLMKAFGMEMSLEFNEDGTGKMNTVIGEESSSEEFKYEIKDGVITIEGAEESAGSIKLEGDKLIMEADGMQIVFKKK